MAMRGRLSNCNVRWDNNTTNQLEWTRELPMSL